jgi:microcystin-dependent protein
MSQPFIGEIRMVGFTFAPQNWAFCAGQLMAIAQNNALFALIGTIYGGDGVQTFALPDLRSRVPMHWGNGPGGFNTVIGEVQGAESVTLTLPQIPNHTHSVPAAAAGTSNDPSSRCYAGSGSNSIYNTTLNAASMAGVIGQAGGSQPHENRMPYLAINFIICLFGIFPSQN